MMIRKALGAAFALALAVPLTASAAEQTSAVPGEKLAEIVPHGAAADGERHVAYVTLDRTLHVVDQRDAAGSFTSSLPAACVDVGSPLVGGGQLVLGCSEGGGPTYRRANFRLDLATRTWSELPTTGWPRYAGPDWFGPGTVGSRWLSLWDMDGPPALVDLRDGIVRRPIGSASEAIDLSADESLRAMCAPLQRPLPARWDGPPFMPTFYDGTTAVAEQPDKSITVQRCGEPRPTLLSRGYPDQLQLGAGVLTYHAYVDDDANKAAFAYWPACRLRLQWPTNGVRHLSHTAHALWIDAWHPVGTAPDELRRIPLPAACDAVPAISVSAGAGRASRVNARGWAAPAWNGASAERLPAPGEAVPRVAPSGRTLIVRTPRPANALTWRVAGARRAMRARPIGRGGRVWRLTPPRAAAGRLVTVAAKGVAPGGGAARFQFALSR